MLAMAIFAGVRGRMETSDVPKFLQGLPIVLVAASIVACSFLGFQGLVAVSYTHLDDEETPDSTISKSYFGASSL